MPFYNTMINRPQLVKHQAAFTGPSPIKTKPITGNTLQATEQLVNNPEIKASNQSRDLNTGRKPNTSNKASNKSNKVATQTTHTLNTRDSAGVRPLNHSQPNHHSTTPQNTDNQSIKTKSASIESTNSNNSGNAKFIMGLNNRIAKQEKRLDAIEQHLKQSVRHSIGYKELGLTLALSLLIFTSVGLFFTNPSEFEHTLLNRLSDIKQLNTVTTSLPNNSKKDSFFSSLISSNYQETTSKHYKWPLEKQNKINETHYSAYKHGININAKLGDPVIAIEDGIVIFSDNNIAGYGNLVLVQHQHDVISVYGNNYSNYVKKGQSIKKGELLAAVGETNGNQPRLYFELRYKGKAQDPFLYYQWFKKLLS